MARLEEVLSPADISTEPSLELEAAIERISRYINRDDFTADSIPSSLRLAARALAGHLQGASERVSSGVVTREQSDDVVVAYDTSGTHTDSSGLTPEVRSLIASYRFSPGL